MKSKGNILIVFIMLMGLALAVFSFVTIITTNIKQTGIETTQAQAFYLAEAGLNKAIWYLNTPTAQGGMGPSWRTTGLTESFGKGSYTISVSDTAKPNEIIIRVTGEAFGYKRQISQAFNLGGLPGAFNYSVFGGSGVSIGRTFNISGDMFVNGNTVFNGSGTAGNVYHPAGYTVSGGGTDAGVPDPSPQLPTLDTTYYSGLINLAASYPTANRNLTGTVNLAGGGIYVNGDVSTGYGTTINGPGVIVATGKISTNGAKRGNAENIILVSGTTMYIEDSSLSNTTFFSSSTASFAREFTGNKTVVLAVGNISTAGSITLGGLMYSKAGQVSLGGTTIIRGSMVAANGVTATKGDITIIHDATQLPGSAPVGFSASESALKKGVWKEY